MNSGRSPLKRARIGLYALAIVAIVALTGSSFLVWKPGVSPGLVGAAALGPSLLLGVVALTSRHLCRVLPLRRGGATRLLTTHLASAAAASGLWVLAWKISIGAIDRMAPSGIRPDPPLLFAAGALLYIATVTVHYLMLEVDAAREAEEAALRYQVLAREAELRAFKAQVDPHFLFNSLNAVASLCGTRPADAREMAQRLADFFRMMLRVGAQERIPLRDEIDLVSRYLAIEKVRFGDRLDVSIDVDAGAAACDVPPLLLQPLVENAVRHGVASMLEGGKIEITATLSEGMLRIHIDNPADPDRDDVRGEGIGLQNARGRLTAVSDGRARLSAEEAEGRFRVAIELPR